MLHHILINGRPLCDHTGCMAGMLDVEPAGNPTCSQPNAAAAKVAVKMLRSAGLKATAKRGVCPSSK